MICPRCGHSVEAKKSESLEEIKAAIERLSHDDRARLGPWLLGRYDSRGYPHPPIR
jgi:hypothetical protein